MIKPYQLVVFDWEGTLGDTFGPVLSAIQKVVQEYGFETCDPLQARKSYYLGVDLLLKTMYPHLSPEALTNLQTLVRHQLYADRHHAYLLPGALNFISQLHEKKIDLAIATNKNNLALEQDLIQTKLKPFFKITRSANQTRPKPHPQMLEEILAYFCVTPTHTLMIGDSESDMMMARALKVDRVAMDVNQERTVELKQAGAQSTFCDYEALSEWFFN